MPGNGAWSRTPSLMTWVTWIAEARSAGKEPITTSPAIQRLLQSEPSQDQGRIMKLALLLLEKDQGPAQAYEQQLAQRPNGPYLTGLAHAYADRLAKRYAEAARGFENLRRSHPDDQEIHRLLVETYTQWADALPLRSKKGPLEKLVALEPGLTSAWRDLGWSLWANKQREAAIQAWNRAISSGGSQRQSIIMQVMALLAESGEAAQAIELYQRWQPGGSLSALGISLAEVRSHPGRRPLSGGSLEGRGEPAAHRTLPGAGQGQKRTLCGLASISGPDDGPGTRRGLP